MGTADSLSEMGQTSDVRTSLLRSGGAPGP